MSIDGFLPPGCEYSDLPGFEENVRERFYDDLNQGEFDEEIADYFKLDSTEDLTEDLRKDWVSLFGVQKLEEYYD